MVKLYSYICIQYNKLHCLAILNGMYTFQIRSLVLQEVGSTSLEWAPPNSVVKKTSITNFVSIPVTGTNELFLLLAFTRWTSYSLQHY